jgi:acetoin utilization protein AcuB
MLAKELMNENIEAALPSDSVGVVRNRMASLKVSHLPLADEGRYVALISENGMQEMSDREPVSREGVPGWTPVSVRSGQHIYEVIDLMARHTLTLLPVVDQNDLYLGSITLPPLVAKLSLLTAAGQPGAILVLTLAPQDYSPALLSRIIEENHANILSLYAVPNPGGNKMEVTIKVNSQETTSIIRSFERYGYAIRSYFLTNNLLDDFYRSRYDEFMKYMNI